MRLCLLLSAGYTNSSGLFMPSFALQLSLLCWVSNYSCVGFCTSMKLLYNKKATTIARKSLQIQWVFQAATSDTVRHCPAFLCDRCYRFKANTDVSLALRTKTTRIGPDSDGGKKQINIKQVHPLFFFGFTRNFQVRSNGSDTFKSCLSVVWPCACLWQSFS